MQNNRIKDDERLKDYMGDASLSSALQYINTKANGIKRYILERSMHIIFAWIPGPLVIVIRSIFYKPLLHGGSERHYIEANTELFHMNSLW